VLYAEEGYVLTAVSGSIQLAADEKYSASLTVLEDVDGAKSTYTEPESGTWVQAESGQITLRPSAADEYTAQWSGRSLTANRPDFVFEYTMD
jgi:hypothetical protein